MEKLFKEYGLNIDENKKNLFKRYLSMLTEYNSRFNITAITDERGVIVKPFIDRALGVELLKGETLADVGSGGGSPAIPLKIIKPDLKISLIEATEKKGEFLKSVVDSVDLKEVTV